MIFFVEKMREEAFALQKLLTSFQHERIFCSAKASHLFSAKNIGIFQIVTFEILMKGYLMALLVLNNGAQFVNASKLQ